MNLKLKHVQSGQEKYQHDAKYHFPSIARLNIDTCGVLFSVSRSHIQFVYNRQNAHNSCTMQKLVLNAIVIVST